ncbi:MAG TPA: glycosyltransferase [Casimicrobiaceae bacterium]
MISVIICSVDSEKFAAVTETYRRHFGEEPYEIVRIHDAKSLCEGYNRGLAEARGDICVFSHDDVEILSNDLGATLVRHLRDWDVVGVAGTARMCAMGWANSGIRYAYGVVTHRVADGYEIRLMGAPETVNGGIQGLDGVFFAARREVAEKIGFDAVSFDGWHGYDTDFTFRCHLAGFRLAVCLDIRLIHFSEGTVDEAWMRYAKRFEDKHAAHLSSEAGPWLEVRKRVATREDVLAAYDMARLRALTDDIRRRV